VQTVVISEMLGVPAEGHSLIHECTNEMMKFTAGAINNLPRDAPLAQDGMLRLTDYFRTIIDERRRNPKDDLISKLMDAEVDGDKLTEEEILSTSVFLIFAGHEATLALISNGLWTLLNYPDQMSLLRENPDLIGTAVEEFLRFESPLQRQLRIATEDVEIGGVTLRKGDGIQLMQGAANHDSEQFENPDAPDITRRENRHLAFGYGIHFCLGAPLARIEGQIAINTLLHRLSNARLAGEQPKWRESMSARCLETFPIEV